MTRIGILTYHYILNNGAILQAYSILTALRKYFGRNSVEIIDYRSTRTEINNLRALHVSKNLIQIVREYRRYLRLKNFIRRELKLSKEKITTDSYNKASNFLKGKYDLIVVGSDAVWRISKNKRITPFPNIYWLDPRLNCKKVAFATSANRADPKNLTIGDKKWMKYSLEGFDLIGFRDKHTFDLIKSLHIRNVDELYKVPDPTFMYHPCKNRSVYSHLVRCGVDIKKPILGILLRDKRLSAQVRQYYKRKGYQIISLGNFNRYADVNLVDKLNLFEWAEAFKHLTFCISDGLHGTILSLKNGIPFVSVDHEEVYLRTQSKICSLLSDFSLLENYINIKRTNYDFDSFFDNAEQALEDWDLDKVKRKSDQMEKKCYAFIERLGRLFAGIER